MNPYAATLVDHTSEVVRPRPWMWRTLFSSYLGTTLAGGVMGMIGGPIGAIVGLVIAATMGAFVFGITLWLVAQSTSPSNPRWCGTIAGAMTGALSLLLPTAGLSLMSVQALAAMLGLSLVPASLGALGGFVGATLAGLGSSSGSNITRFHRRAPDSSSTWNSRQDVTAG